MDNFCRFCGAAMEKGVQVCPRCHGTAEKKKSKLKMLMGVLVCLLTAYSVVGMLLVTGILDLSPEMSRPRPPETYMPPGPEAGLGRVEEPEEDKAVPKPQAPETQIPETAPPDPYVAIGEQCVQLEKEGGASSVLQYLQSVDADRDDPRYGQLMEQYLQLRDAETVRAADALAEEGRYPEAIQMIWTTEGYLGSETLVDALSGYFRACSVHKVAAGRRFTGRILADGTVDIWGHSEMGPCDTSQWHDIESIAMGDFFIAGLTYDGTVVASGPDTYYKGCQDWTGISVLVAGDGYTMGLKYDGTLIAVGQNASGQLMVDALYGDVPIVSIAAGYEHTVALRADGTVTAIGRNDHGQCEVSGWTDIIAIAAGSEHTVGLKADGSVVATGANNYRQCGVGNWNQIVAISAGDYFTMGLQSNGTVVAIGQNVDGQCFTDQWRDVVEIAGGNHQAVGLQKDGILLNAGQDMGYE